MNSLTVLMPGFVGTEAPDWLVARLAGGMGGVCLFAENVASLPQVRDLTSSLYEARPAAIVSMDEEGGDVSRLHQREGSPFPGNAVLGRLGDASLTRGVGVLVGLELRSAGVGLALAPDADVNSNPDNPVIGVRSFGADPAVVTLHTAAWTEGLQSTGVAACAKHFPGHGDTSQDSHVERPVVTADEATLRSRELMPFRAAIAAGTRTVMTSHTVVTALDPEGPATFSHRILTGLLREELGFEGVIVTDALDMVGASGGIGIPAAAVASLAAGADLLCIGTRNTDAQIGEIAAAIDAAVAEGTLPSARLASAIARVEALGAHLAVARSTTVTADDAREVDSTDVRKAFHVSARAQHLLERVDAVAFVALESPANVAVGDSPWGPFAAGVVPAVRITEESNAVAELDSIADDVLVVVVGKDIHRHAFAREAIEALRARREILVVDMGWPLPDFDDIDIATFGASRLVGKGLIELIGHDSCGLA